jgi:hypothetical protein
MARFPFCDSQSSRTSTLRRSHGRFISIQGFRFSADTFERHSQIVRNLAIGRVSGVSNTEQRLRFLKSFQTAKNASRRLPQSKTRRKHLQGLRVGSHRRKLVTVQFFRVTRL